MMMNGKIFWCMPLNIYEKKKRSTKLNKPTDKETSNKITVDSESEEDYFDVSSAEEL